MVKTNPPNKTYKKIARFITNQNIDISRIKNLIKISNKDNKIKLYPLLFKQLTIKRLAEHRKRNVSSVDPQRKKLTFAYARYADDWILINNAPIDINKKIKNCIKEWLLLNRNAILSEEKTLITDIRKDPAHFLGFEIQRYKSKKLAYDKKGSLRRSPSLVKLSVDKKRLINRMFIKGYCDKKGFPKEIPWLQSQEPYIIIERFNAVIKGFVNFYYHFLSNSSSLNRWVYILRWSAIKTLANKFHTTIPKIFNMFGNPITAVINLKLKDEEVYKKSISLIDFTTALKECNNKNLKLQIIKERAEIIKGNFIFYDNSKHRTPPYF